MYLPKSHTESEKTSKNNSSNNWIVEAENIKLISDYPFSLNLSLSDFCLVNNAKQKIRG